MTLKFRRNETEKRTFKKAFCHASEINNTQTILTNSEIILKNAQNQYLGKCCFSVRKHS